MAPMKLFRDGKKILCRTEDNPRIRYVIARCATPEMAERLLLMSRRFSGMSNREIEMAAINPSSRCMF